MVLGRKNNQYPGALSGIEEEEGKDTDLVAVGTKESEQVDNVAALAS